MAFTLNRKFLERKNSYVAPKFGPGAVTLAVIPAFFCPLVTNVSNHHSS
jgi:hypothetical protein